MPFAICDARPNNAEKAFLSEEELLPCSFTYNRVHLRSAVYLIGGVWTNTVGFGPRPGLPAVPFPYGSSFETVSPKKLQCKDGGRFRQRVAESYSSNRKSCNFGSKSCYSVTKLVFATQPKGVRNPGQQPLGRFICWLLLVLVPKQKSEKPKKERRPGQVCRNPN